MTPEERLKKLGIVLPPVVEPRGSFIGGKQVGDLLFLSGQDPFVNGSSEYIGKVGSDLTVEEGYKAARICGLNLLSQAKSILGSLDRVKEVINLKGYVASENDFYHQFSVVNGASDLMVEVFGEAGKHTRCAIGTNVLLHNIPVEVEMILKVD